MIKLEIDGQSLEAAPGSMVIQAADAAGIYIPRFCYHKKLSVAANCRMCLIQVGEGKKPAPACATPVAEGMKISTQSDVAVQAQKAVMEFLLINHPLDCPICDQGGQCELQDLALGYGSAHSRYAEPKRVVTDQDQGPLVATNMTRCIQCTRCVRFGREIAGLQELGVLGRGEHEHIGTLVTQSMTSELSGNLVEVCPVGALLAKPSLYQARAWELTQRPSLSPHDGIGSHLSLHIRNHSVIRVVPREEETLNEMWLSDRDRFSYEALASDERVTEPLIKKNGQWQSVDWLTAFEFATQQLQTVLNHDGAEQICGLLSASCTLEEQYLFQKLLRGVGCHHIDHRLSQVDLTTDFFNPTLGASLAELETLQTILLIGANIQKDQPVLSVRLRRAVQKGVRLINVSTNSYQQNLPFAENIVASNLAETLQKQTMLAYLNHNALIVLGSDLIAHPELNAVKKLAETLSEKTGARLGYLAPGANSVGAYLTQCVPDREGLNWQEAFQNARAAYLLMGTEPERDCARPGLALNALKKAKTVIVLNTFKSEAMLEYADVILPISPFSENSGTFVNVEGRFQAFQAAMLPLKEVRPAWKVLRVLSHFLKVEDMAYVNLGEVSEAAKKFCGKRINVSQIPLQRRGGAEGDGVVDRIKYLFITSTNQADGLLRRAKSLQARPEQSLKCVMNAATRVRLGYTQASHLNFHQADRSIQIPLEISESIAENIALVFTGFAALSHFDPYASFEVSAC